MDKQLLHFLATSDVYIGKMLSGGFKDTYLDTEAKGFSPIKGLYNILIEYYLVYHKIATSADLPKYLARRAVAAEEQKALLFLFEEVKDVTPEHDFEFIKDTLKDNYARNILYKHLDIGTSLLMRNDIPNALNEIKSAIFATENVLNETAVSGELKESIQARGKTYSDVKNKLLQIGLPTGFPTLDRCSGGMKPGELIVVMAGTREGKSVFLLNVGYHLYHNMHKNVLHVSIENTKSQVERRFDSRAAGLACNKIRDGLLDKAEEEIYKQEWAKQMTNPAVYYIWDQPVCSPQRISAKMTELASKYKFDIVIVDYVGLMMSDKPRKDSGWQEMSDITLDLRKLARSHNIPLLTAAQVGRAGMKTKKAYYDHADIGYSHAIIQNSDTVLSFKVSDPELLKTELGYCELNANIVKSRDGTEGTFIIDANFDRMFMHERGVI